MQLNILVFPCGSEVALEIHRALKYSRNITIFGANSIDDHGKFVFENYIGNIPFYDDSQFVSRLNEVIIEYKIDAIYPAMDSVIAELSSKQRFINCKIVGSKDEVNQICLSKSRTYQELEGCVKLPKKYTIDESAKIFYPVFLKPDIGYGSRGTKRVDNLAELESYLENHPNSLILEYLPGEEYTVDCFTNRHGELLYSGARKRSRISNGISVNTKQYFDNSKEIKDIVESINKKISFRGAWFIQLKQDEKGEMTLLEIASRIGGSSALNRNLGVNFPLLSIFDAFELDVDVFTNDYKIEMDRSLDNKYKVELDYNRVYIDFDDCLIIKKKVNISLLSFLYQSINLGKKIILITKHNKNIMQTLEEYRLTQIFDEIIHLERQDEKFNYMDPENAIFIDDSHYERKQVYTQLKMPVFAPDNVECLLL